MDCVLSSVGGYSSRDGLQDGVSSLPTYVPKECIVESDVFVRETRFFFRPGGRVVKDVGGTWQTKVPQVKDRRPVVKYRVALRFDKSGYKTKGRRNPVAEHWTKIVSGSPSIVLKSSYCSRVSEYSRTWDF
jgi:hypothetical protein